MKASKAAKNWSRKMSRSTSSSCSAPSTMTMRPARRREAKRSAARASVTWSAPAAIDQRRRQRPAREIGVLEFAHQPKGGVEPADGRIAEAEFRVGRDDAGGAGVAHGVGGQPIVLERQRGDDLRAAAARERPAEPDRVERFDQAARGARPFHAGERDHRRRQHQSVERAAAGARDRQRDRRAHRMGEAEPRLADRRSRAPRLTKAEKSRS